tara:strand:- start:724 stop:951 length:228 start_codon:yes stop_codon:yes gene_type:complete
MKERVKSWKTTLIGAVAIIGLIYKGYTSGGFEVSDFLILAAGVGFIGIKEKSTFRQDAFKTFNTGGHPDPKKEEK